MEKLVLRQPDASMLLEVAGYQNDMKMAGSSMDGCGSLSRHTPEEWLDNCIRLTREETCPEGWVPATQYVCQRQSDGRIVGMIDLRHRFNDFLREYGGNVGYSVRPDERRKGVAKWMLSCVLKEAKELGMQRVLVTCDAENEGSRRTIEANGGVFERDTYLESDGLILKRYWIDL